MLKTDRWKLVSGQKFPQSHHTAPKMKFSDKDFFSKCDQIRSFLRIWSHLLKQSVIRKLLFFLCSIIKAIRTCCAPVFFLLSLNEYLLEVYKGPWQAFMIMLCLRKWLKAFRRELFS